MRPRLTVLLILLALFSVAGCLGSLHWVLDACSHFRWQYLGAAAVLLLPSLWLRSRLLIGLASSVLLFNLLLIWPGQSVQPAAPGQPRLRVVTVNLQVGNPDLRQLVEWLRASRVDVLVVVELSPAAVPIIDAIDPQLRQVHVAPAEDPFGLGVWSRVPVTESEVRELGPFQIPSVRVALQPPSQPAAQLYATHPFPPVGGDGTVARDTQLLAVAEWIGEHPEPTIVAGDLNASPWSAGLRALTTRAGLTSGTQQLWPWPTWKPNRGGPLAWLFAVPIDHVLLRAGHPTTREIGPDFGSDHRPVLLELVWD